MISTNNFRQRLPMNFLTLNVDYPMYTVKNVCHPQDTTVLKHIENILIGPIESARFGVMFIVTGIRLTQHLTRSLPHLLPSLFTVMQSSRCEIGNYITHEVARERENITRTRVTYNQSSISTFQENTKFKEHDPSELMFFD